MEDISTYKKTHFVQPELIHTGYATYAIRNSLIKAVSELKGKINGRVLDIGCGIMPYREFLLDSGNITDYIGLDIEISEYHNKNTADMFWNGEKIPLDNESCDWVIATEFLEHYHDIELILREVHRVLKKGGTFFFTVPCIWPLHEVPYDEHRFTPFSLEKYFQRIGFSNIEIKALGGINRSLAIMYGIWLDNSGMKGFKKRFYQIIFKPLFKILIKKDNSNVEFVNGEMPSGLYGFITK